MCCVTLTFDLTQFNPLISTFSDLPAGTFDVDSTSKLRRRNILTFFNAFSTLIRRRIDVDISTVFLFCVEKTSKKRWKIDVEISTLIRRRNFDLLGGWHENWLEVVWWHRLCALLASDRRDVQMIRNIRFAHEYSWPQRWRSNSEVHYYIATLHATDCRKFVEEIT